MSNRKIEMYEYRQVIYRLQQGESVRLIAKDKLVSRTKATAIKVIATQQGWLELGAEIPADNILEQFFSKNVVPQQTPKVEPYADQIKNWVNGGIQASVIHQHLVDQYNFDGHYNSVQRYVQRLNQKTPDLTIPLFFKPGEAAQVDFGMGPKLFDERTGKTEKTWFFVITLCWSRHQYAELITHQDIETWLNCHQNAFNWFGGVPRKIIIDNPKCAITRACYYDPHVQRSYNEFAQAYGFIISACAPRDPKKKGRVESGVKYVKNNFAPLKNFSSLQDANKQLKRWVLGQAGNRKHGSTFEAPLKRFTEIECTTLKSLPVAEPEIAVWQKVKPYRNCHIRYLKCNYSAPYTLYDKELWIKVSKTIVTLYHENIVVAKHPRLYKPGLFSTKNEHLPPNSQIFLQQDPQWCHEQSEKVGPNTKQVVETLLTDPVVDLLRAAQGIIKLARKYGNSRLEAACRRAIHYQSLSYEAVNKILKTGSDYHVLTEDQAFDQLGQAYQGSGEFQRETSGIVQ